MGSALLNTTTDAEFASGEESVLPDGRTEALSPHASADALRAQVAERLAAHRRRRGGEPTQSSHAASEPARPAKTRSSQIAAAVAERYAQTQSYRAFLAAEAERAVQQARAAAEVAAMNAQAVAAAQQRLLEAFDEHADRSAHHEAAQSAEVHENALAEAPRTVAPAASAELNLWPDLEPAPRTETPRPARTLRCAPAANPASDNAGHELAKPTAKTASPGITVRLYEGAASAGHVNFGLGHHAAVAGRTNRPQERNEAEGYALDEEIAFRQAPVFEEPAGPPVPLPANLIEFPRQLVASRKARPRYAEGPLRDEAEAAPGDGQLRIFEVDATQISTTPEADAAEGPAPQWTSIWLDTPHQTTEMQAGAARDYVPVEYAAAMVEPAAMTAPLIQAASISRRVLAAAINATIVLAGVLAFAATFVAIATRGIDWHPGGSRLQAVRQIAAAIASQTGLQPAQAATIATGAGVALILLYQSLFFRFSEATPGMRCARLAFCTFDDENPTRRAILRRSAAMLLSVCPLGLGFVSATLDEERLTWHDRMTRMYLRRY